LLSLIDRVNAVTDNGFDDVVIYRDATSANEVSPETMERPVPEQGNRDEQRHEDYQLDERQRHCVEIAYTVSGLSRYLTRELLALDNPLIRPSTLTLDPDDEYRFAVHDLRIDPVIRRMSFRLVILVRADNRQLSQLRLGHASFIDLFSYRLKLQG
jgi:hypothetical protein